MDNRAVDQADRINATKHPVLRYCGDADSPEWMIPKVLWIKENQKDIYNRSYKIIEQLDYLNYKLCGVLSSSICQATCKWNYVESEGGYQKDFMEAIGLEDYEEKMVTRVDKIGTYLGKISPEFAREFDLNPDMIIVQGGVDAHLSLIHILTPGLAFFYGGLVRRKNVCNTIMACIAIMGLSVVMWTLFGYSLAFGGNHAGIIGDFRWFRCV